MKKILFTLALSTLGLNSLIGQNQMKDSISTTTYHAPEPILVETMVGNKWGMLQSIILKKFTPTSKFSFFNLTNYEKTYKKDDYTNYIIQSLVYYQPVKNLYFGLGANLKAFGGFKPLFSAAYTFNNRNITLIVQPSIEIDKKGVGELFSLFEFRGAKGRKVEPFFSVQGATSFVARDFSHDYSYVNARVGIQMKNFRFGPAMNFRSFGPSPKSEVNLGAFVGIVMF